MVCKQSKRRDCKYQKTKHWSKSGWIRIFKPKHTKYPNESGPNESSWIRQWKQHPLKHLSGIRLDMQISSQNIERIQSGYNKIP